MIFIRYGVVQAFAFALDIGIFIALINFTSINPILSNLLGKIVAGVFGFYFQRNFVFLNSRSNLVTFQAIKFVSILFINNLLQLVMMATLINFISSEVLAKILADTASILISFCAGKYYIFSNKKAR